MKPSVQTIGDRPVPLELRWVRCGDQWCRFEAVNLANVTAHGIYLIWYKGKPGRVVRVGQGDIVARLEEHRQDQEILAYRDQGLLVTWATVDPAYQDGVERYFANTYPPLTGERFPDVDPIEANPPWG